MEAYINDYSFLDHHASPLERLYDRLIDPYGLSRTDRREFTGAIMYEPQMFGGEIEEIKERKIVKEHTLTLTKKIQNEKLQKETRPNNYNGAQDFLNSDIETLEINGGNQYLEVTVDAQGNYNVHKVTGVQRELWEGCQGIAIELALRKIHPKIHPKQQGNLKGGKLNK